VLAGCGLRYELDRGTDRRELARSAVQVLDHPVARTRLGVAAEQALVEADLGGDGHVEGVVERPAAAAPPRDDPVLAAGVQQHPPRGCERRHGIETEAGRNAR
jgi:hypothetical protein